MKGSLILANGDTFIGQWHGKEKDHMGELIYFTGMGRFQEFITDPANFGKIVVATFPGILNSDIDTTKFESDQIHIGGLITQQDSSLLLKDGTSNLMDVFKEQTIPIMSGADTRAIIKRIKKEGEQPAILTTHQKGNRLPPVSEWKLNSKQITNICEQGKKHIVILNFGYKKSLLKQMSDKDVKITIISGDSNAEAIDSLQPDGVIFSGGPGNPASWKKHFPEYKKIAMTYPTVGLGLGHQVLPLSFGAAAEKMPTGHRNFKEAVIHTATNKIFMSCQNHEYLISEKNIGKSGFKVSFKNVHDGSIEGLVHDKYPLATYQFHPEQINNPLNQLIFLDFFQQVFESKGERIYA